MANTEACETCGGSGKQLIELADSECKKNIWGGNALAVQCLTCRGAGKLPAGQNERNKAAFEAFWCSCSDSPFGAWHEDGECAACSKHHAHCATCGKINQVG